MLIVLFLLGCSSGESKITEAEIRDAISKMEAATVSKDVESIVAGLSERVQMKATVTALGQTQTLNFNRDQYRDFLKKTYAAASDYTFSRENLKIKISADGRSAVVTSEVSESLKMNGLTVRSVATEVASFTRENGKVVILYFDVNGRQV